MAIIYVLIALVALGLLVLGSSVRVITQFERGVVLRLGRLRAGTRGPGLALIAPVVDRLHKVNVQIITRPVPAQAGITRDNVTVSVDAVVYYRSSTRRGWASTCRTTTTPSAKSRRLRCDPSSARATSTISCPIGSGSTRASS